MRICARYLFSRIGTHFRAGAKLHGVVGVRMIFSKSFINHYLITVLSANDPIKYW
jgi:hypothetical protein